MCKSEKRMGRYRLITFIGVEYYTQTTVPAVMADSASKWQIANYRNNHTRETQPPFVKKDYITVKVIQLCK